MLLKSLIFHYHGLDEDEEKILNETADKLGAHIELRWANDFIAQDFLSIQSLLNLIGESFEFERTDAPFDSTAVRFDIPGQGTFGIIANESEPFCSACTRLRLSSDGYLYGCLSSPRRESIRDLLTLPQHLVFPQLQARLLAALNVKQQTFQGETTVMKFIGG
jgi:cyclic pyranopterin phosphate synthase